MDRSQIVHTCTETNVDTRWKWMAVLFSKLASTDRVMLLGQLRPSFDGAAVDFAGAGKKG